MTFRLLPRAMEDVSDIATVIAAESVTAAHHWLDNLQQCCRRLGDMPGMGVSRAEIAEGVRLLPLGSYVILYREEQDGVAIVRVVHGRRDPETWL